jgi:hypothetical protein
MLAADGVKNLDKGSWSDGKSITLSPETGKGAEGERENAHPMRHGKVRLKKLCMCVKGIGEAMESKSECLSD